MTATRAIPLAACLLWGCPRQEPPPRPDAAPPRPDAGATKKARPCPAQAPAPAVFPHTRPRHRTAEFWLAGRADDAVDARHLRDQNSRVRLLKHEGWPSGRFDLLSLRFTRDKIRQRLHERAGKLREAVEEGKRVMPDGTPARALAAALAKKMRQAKPADELRLVLKPTALRCFPHGGPVYEKAWDEAFDLLQCSWLRIGEPVRVFARGEGYWYVWTEYAEGWVEGGALTAPLTAAQAKSYLRSKRKVMVQADRLPLWADPQRSKLLGVVRLGVTLPLAGRKKGWLQVVAPTAAGLGEGWLRDTGASVTTPSLSRAVLLRRAFALLGSTYGWGGAGGTRDCSRFMMDLFGAFGVLLPRNSWHQSNAGTGQVDVSAMDEATKARTMEQHSKKGIVLLYLPGHIMLYLGKDGARHYALHQFSGYLVPCKGGGETMMRVNRAEVTSLELGRGSSRKAFMERITKLVLFQ